MNQVFDAGLTTLGAVGISMVSKKAMGDPPRRRPSNPWSVPSTGIRILKMRAAIASGTMLIQYLQKQKLIPDDPFKKE